MDTDSTFAILKATVELLFAVSLPLLLVGLIVGVAVSLIQAAVIGCVEVVGEAARVVSGDTRRRAGAGHCLA